MSRADDTTQGDYSLLDDRALGDAVAEKVLGWTWSINQFLAGWHHDGFKYTHGEHLVSWWGAGLVIDTMYANGWEYWIDRWRARFTSDNIVAACDGDGMHTIRRVLIAALAATEAEA